MKNTNKSIFILSLLGLCILFSCKKDKPLVISDPQVVTQDVDINTITDAQALISFTINSDGNSPIKECGYCWSRTNPSPTIDDVNHTFTGGPQQSPVTINANLSSLNPFDTYYVRAYATNEAGKTGYGEVKTFKTARGTFKDNDGNSYHTITIGNQVWMQENWKNILFGKTGAVIPKLEDNTSWTTTISPAFCWYENDPTNNTKKTYGGLYNWYAVSHPDFAPNGWSVPTFSNFLDLISFLGGANIAGGKLKDTKMVADGGTWDTPNTGATNEVGFTGLASGVRSSFITNGITFHGLKIYMCFWSNTLALGDNAYTIQLSYTDSEALFSNFDKKSGFSVRLIRDKPAND